jgi:DNA-3-methyladenine glycosylase II
VAGPTVIAMTSFTHEITPQGPFDLAFQNRHFNPWPTLDGDLRSAVMAFPVEGWAASAVVVVQQLGDGRVVAEATGDGADLQRATAQALESMSLDVDATGWAAIGDRDPVIGALQHRFRMIRPSMFHSPYEAAAAFVIGHRISVAQTRVIRDRLARQIGQQRSIGGEQFAAFPGPRQLLALDEIPGISGVKTTRLHGVAEAALDGRLDRARLRTLDEADALALLQTIDGVGPFFASGILYRGAGIPNGLIADDRSLEMMREAYERPDARSGELIEIANRWAPYRSWATTLIHLGAERPHRRG